MKPDAMRSCCHAFAVRPSAGRATAGHTPYAHPMTTASESVWDIPLTTIDGESTSLRAFDGKAILIVNVASRCGLAPQYEKLEELQKTYGDRGLTVLGFPSNQFLQELGSEDAIKE